MKYYILSFLILLLSGCTLLNKKSPAVEWNGSTLQNDISNNSDKVGDVSKVVGKVAVDQVKINNDIGQQTTLIKNDSGPKYDKSTSAIYSGIQQSNGLMSQLNESTTQLNATKVELANLEAQAKSLNGTVTDLNKTVEKITKENESLKNELSVSTKKLLNKILSALIALGIVAVGVSAFVAFSAVQAGHSPFKAAAIAVGGITITSMSIGYMYYSEAIGKVIFAIIIVVVLSLAYKIYLEITERMKVKEELAIKDKTIEYGTLLTENIKTEVMTPEERKKWFGSAHTDGIAGMLQKDERVKAVVHEARKKINEIDKPVMENAV